MLNVPNDLKQLFITGSTFQFNTKFDILDKNYNIVASFTEPVINGRITVDRSRTSVRSYELSLTNGGKYNGQFTWGTNNLIYIDKLIKIYFGVWTGSYWEWIPQGVFPVSSPSVVSKPSISEVTLRGSDKMSALGRTINNLTVSANTDIGTAIKSVLSGIETLGFIFDDTSSMQKVPYDMSWSSGVEYSKIISDLAGIITWEIYYDVNGYLRLRAPIDPNTTPPMLSLSSSTTSFNLWAGAERVLDDSSDSFANYIVVRGGSSQTGFVSYTLEDNDVTSATSTTRIGRRVYLHNNGNTDPVISTLSQAVSRAQYEYKKRVKIAEQLNWDSFPIPYLEHDEVLAIQDDNAGISGNYQIVSFTLPLGASNQMMSGTMWKNRSFSF
jgi:hypothetical protein